MIRFATKKDIPDINKLGLILNKNFIKTYDIDNYLSNDNYLIVVNDDKIINGLLITYKNLDYWELEVIVVAPNYRRQGIARNLLSKLITDYAKGKDILLEVSVDNVPACDLYKKNKFEVINIRKNYYDKTDAYVMKRVVK